MKRERLAADTARVPSRSRVRRDLVSLERATARRAGELEARARPDATSPLIADPAQPIVAVVAEDGEACDEVMLRVIEHLTRNGARCTGFVQDRGAALEGSTRCDMILRSIADGTEIQISERRGAGARGCRLDVGRLLEAVVGVRSTLATRPDLVVVNRFGKTEAEGGGFASVIAEAMDLSVPVLIGVTRRNLDAWRAFAGGLAVDLDVEAQGDISAGVAMVLAALEARLSAA